MSNKNYHGEEISANTYAALTRHQFNLESLGERLQRIENTTATMKDKWRRGDEAMRDFTGTWRGDGIEEVSNLFPRVAFYLWCMEKSSRVYDLSLFAANFPLSFLLFFLKIFGDSSSDLHFFQVILSFPSLFLFRVFRMRDKSDPALGSSSNDSRVRSKNKVGVEPLESMDSSDLSLDLTLEIESLNYPAAKGAQPAAEAETLPPMGPLSIIGVEEVASWREKFQLADDVVIRVPDPIDRVSDFDEIPVYKGFFESGFRDQIPSLVAKVSEVLGISPGQLNPPSWRTMIAMQNLGDLEDLVIGVAEVLYSYSISPFNGGEGRYHLHPRNKELPVQEISKKEKKCHQVFDGLWTEKFAFMHLPRFSFVWHVAGKRTTEQVLKLPIELLDPFPCEQRSVRMLQHLGYYVRIQGRGSTGGVQESLRVHQEQQAQTIAAPAPSSSKKSKASRSTPKISPSSSCESGTVLTKLNTKAMSQLFHLGERMDDQASIKADMDALASQLHEEKDNVLAKKKEIKSLRLKVRNQDEAGMMAASENISLREQLERREEEICDLKEWLNHQIDGWKPAVALEQYKMVKTSEAQLQRLPAPSFEEEPSVPGEIEAEKTLEPTADDPPAD
ncbi:hypothetical protein DY000_02016134 [Brassica cretica]|uniref:Aminotransferase-like plant mobile domain-containing protein n=1 Tax=Brassica cretica TaxID=69181 RepID=A0ABQ7CL98_BRACR|nr:hypothetical protein DY000_02016134 [Brassica cretica]